MEASISPTGFTDPGPDDLVLKDSTGSTVEMKEV